MTRKVGISFLILNIIIGLIPWIALSGVPVNLEACYEAAIQRSETLSEKEQLLTQSQELESQAVGNILPNVSGSAAYFVQQSPSDPLTQSFFPSNQPTVKLTVSQSIFRGLREFAYLRQLSHLTAVQEQEKQRALVQLRTDVSRTYYGLLLLGQDMMDLKAQLDLYEERIKELKKRAKSGQSSPSETLTSQAAQAATLAQLKQVEGQYRSMRELFLFLTGLPRDFSLARVSHSFRDKASLSDYLKSLESRPDIVAEKQRLDASEETISIAKGNYLPSADVIGNYYLIRPAGVFNEIKWDVQATLSMPLYSGGIVQSKVREAVSRKTQAELALSRARRSAEQEIRSLYENYQSGLQQIEALEQSIRLADQNYRVLNSDYRRGLARNIDVLQALSQFQEGKRALNRARWNTQADHTRLQLISNLQSLSPLRQ